MSSGGGESPIAGTPLPGGDLESVWVDLRRHLEWTRGASSIVFLLAATTRQLDEIGARVMAFADLHSIDVHTFEVAGVDDVRTRLRKLLPFDGIAWLHGPVTGAIQSWRSALAALNESRASIARSHGALIIAGPAEMGAIAAREAGDLWSIRSVVRELGDSGHAVPRPLRDEGDSPANFLSFSTIYLPSSVRGPRTRGVVELLDVAQSLARTSHLPAARGFVDDAEIMATGEPAAVRALVQLAAAELAVLDDDIAYVAAAAQRGHDIHVAEPPELAVAIDRLLGRSLERAGNWAAARDLYAARLAYQRGSTQRSARGDEQSAMAVTLDDLARAAEAEGDLTAAREAYTEALALRRDIMAQDKMIDSARGVAVTLNDLGRIAQQLGDFSVAESAYTESLQLRRYLAKRSSSTGPDKDFLVALSNLGGLRETVGDWSAAEEAYGEMHALAQQSHAQHASDDSLRWLTRADLSLDRVHTEMSGGTQR